MQSYTLTNLLVTLEHGPSKGWSGVHLLHDNASCHKCEVVKSFLASEKVKVLNHPPYSPDLSPCDFFLFPRLKKMLSGNKYTSRSSLGSAIYQCLQQIPKKTIICFSRLGKKVTNICFSKGGILWRFVIKICLIKRSTEVIRTQWQNFLQDPRIKWTELHSVAQHSILRANLADDSLRDFLYPQLWKVEGKYCFCFAHPAEWMGIYVAADYGQFHCIWMGYVPLAT